MVSAPVVAFEQIDHIDCVSHNLAQTQERYRQLGFNVVGPIDGNDEPQTSTCWIVAANLYLSCSTFVHFDKLHPVMQHYMATPGVGAALWHVSDAQRAARELAAAGFEVYPAVEGERQVVVQGQPRHYRFLILPYVPPAGIATGDFLNLAIRHYTRDIPAHPTHLRHPNGLREICQLTAVVPNLDEVAAGLTCLHGAAAIRRGPSSIDFDAATLQRRFLSPERYDAQYGAVTGPDRPKVVKLVVNAVDDVRRRCEEHAIRYSLRSDGNLVVSSAHIAGTALEFTEVAG